MLRYLFKPLLVLFVFLAGTWIGALFFFPGAELARIGSSWAATPALHVGLDPLELHWNGLYTPELQLQPSALPPNALPPLSKVWVPWRFGLLYEAYVEAELPQEGHLALSQSWSPSGSTELTMSSHLESFPLLRTLLPTPYGPWKLSGQLRLNLSSLAMRQALPNSRVPDGTLNGTLENVHIADVRVAGQQLPEIVLERVVFTLEGEAETQRVHVRTFRSEGDWNMQVGGTITIRPQGLRYSMLALRGRVSFPDSWRNKLGPLQFILGGRSGSRSFRLSGSLEAPRFNFENR